jgi:hypothetical protein
VEDEELMFARLVTLIAIIGIAYVLLTQGLPWFQTRLGTEPAGSDSAGDPASERCVATATRASDTLSGEVVRFSSPPVDPAEWSAASWDIDNAIQEAELACTCFTEACQKAAEALDAMRQLYTQFNDMVRGTPTGWGNPAHDQERIYQLLDDARAALSG